MVNLTTQCQHLATNCQHLASIERQFRLRLSIPTATRGRSHRLTYKRTNHDNLNVRGYKEEGITTTPVDITVLNDPDRFTLAGDEFLQDTLAEHKTYIVEHGDDMPKIRDWKWAY